MVVFGTRPEAIKMAPLCNRLREQKDIETQEFFGRYRAQREKYGYSEEEKAEMRAEFGDEEAVDVFTGKVIS